MTSDVVVVGGGIGGAVLAGLLGRAGKKVIVLERNLATSSLSRPEVLWPRSMETLFSLSSRERWERDAATPLRGIDFHDGQRVVPLLRESVLRSEPRLQPWSTDPNRTREQLLGLDSFEVRRGVEVTSVLKEGNRVVGVRTRELSTQREVEVLSNVTVGDDGANSLVRKACGISVALRRFPVEFMCFGGDWPASVPQGCARVWWNPNALQSGIVGMLIVPLPNNRCAALVPALSSALAVNPSVDESWARFSKVDPVIAERLAGRRFPTDMARVIRPWGHAAQYGCDGAVIMGDAAHPVSPAGGQGANMSIADAVVLAELMSGDAADLVTQYERLRRPANAASIRPTRGADIVWSAPQWLSPLQFAPFIAGRVAGCPALQQRFIRSIGGAFQGAAT